MLRAWVVVSSLLAALVIASPAHAARAWQEPVEIAPASGPPGDSTMSPTNAGETVFAWGNGYASPVQARVRNAAGVATEPVTLGGFNSAIDVAALGAAGSAVVWHGAEVPHSSQSALWLAEYDPVGGFSRRIRLDPSDFGSERPDAAIATNSAGQAVVVYKRSGRVYAVERSTSGEWSAPRALSIPEGGRILNASVGMSQAGEVIYAWTVVPDGAAPEVWSITQPVVGQIEPPRRLSGDGPAKLADVRVNSTGAAVVVWGEGDGYEGPVGAALRPALGTFGPPIRIGSSADFLYGISVGLSESGHVITAWSTFWRRSATGGYTDGTWASAGSIRTGAFSAPQRVSAIDGLAGGTQKATIDPLGNALILFEDWDTRELRVVRRSVDGVWGRERPVVPCNRGDLTIARSAMVDAAGNASVLWQDYDYLKLGNPLMLSFDRPSATFSPDPCPPPDPPFLSWSPREPAVGEPVRFDARGAIDPDAARTTFEWDLDGDGTLETNSGENPVVHHAFSEGGERTFRLRVSEYSQRAGNGSSGTYTLRVRVGMDPVPPPPPNSDPRGSDPRPPDTPDEAPWPLAPSPAPSEPGAPEPPDPPDLPDPIEDDDDSSAANEGSDARVVIERPAGGGSAAVPSDNPPSPGEPMPALATPFTLESGFVQPISFKVPRKVSRRSLRRRGLVVSVWGGGERVRIMLRHRGRLVARKRAVSSFPKPALVRLRMTAASASRLRPGAAVVVEMRSSTNSAPLRQRVRVAR